MKQRLLILLCTIALSANIVAQNSEAFPPPNLRAWESSKTQQTKELSRKPIPYVPLTDNNIVWSKRVTREIYLSERMNAALYYPLVPSGEYKSLFDIIVESVTIPQGQNEFGVNTLTAYGDENFTEKLSPEEIAERLTYTIVVKKMSDSGDEYNEQESGPVESKMIYSLRLVEDWYFDKSRSEFKVQIVAFTFIYKVSPDKPEIKGTFWIYYPESRWYLDNAYAFNTRNVAQPLTFEQILSKRLFSSVIIKEENDKNKMISEYEKTVLDQLLESEKINNQIRQFEIDLWTY